MTTEHSPSDRQLGQTLNDVLLELVEYWHVPLNCPTMQALSMVQRSLISRDTPSHEHLENILQQIRSRRNKPSDQSS